MCNILILWIMQGPSIKHKRNACDVHFPACKSISERSLASVLRGRAFYFMTSLTWRSDMPEKDLRVELLSMTPNALELIYGAYAIVRQNCWHL